MAAPDVLERVAGILAEWFEVDSAKIRQDASLVADLGLDSLDIVDLVVALEKEFGFKVVRAQDEPAMRQMRTLADVVAFVNGKTQKTQETRKAQEEG